MYVFLYIELHITFVSSRTVQRGTMAQNKAFMVQVMVRAYVDVHVERNDDRLLHRFGTVAVLEPLGFVRPVAGWKHQIIATAV